VITATAQLTGAKDFERLCAQMAELTGRDRTVIVRNAARDFCRAALRITPMADPRTKTNKRWVVLYHRYTGELVTFPGTAKQAELYGVKSRRGAAGSRVRNRGFAKSAWVGCLKKLGVSARAPGDRTPEKRTGELLMSDVVKVHAKDAGYIEVANQTPPIAALDHGNRWTPAHHIADRAMHVVVTRMEKTLARLRARQESRWQR